MPGTPPRAPARASRPASRMYTIFWLVMTLGALGYLFALATNPTLLASLVDPGQPQRLAEAERAQAEQRAAMLSLEDRVMAVQSDITRLRSTVDAQREASNRLESRVIGLEQRTDASTKPVPVAEAAPAGDPASAALGPVRSLNTAKAPDVPAKQPASIAAQAAETPPTGAAAAKKVVAKAEPASKALQSGAKPSARIETGSLKKDTPEAPKAERSTPVGVQIASGTSLEAIRLSWSLLSERHSENFRGMEPRYVTGQDADGPTYGLIAGPIKTQSDARQLCKTLQAKAIACKVSNFSGNSL